VTGADGRQFASRLPGQVGWHVAVASMDVLIAVRHCRRLPVGGYVRQRVFFVHEEDARAAGYRPCAVCMPAAYAVWKNGQARC